MIRFAWPWIFLLLPLPWVLRRLLPPASPLQEPALRVPSLRAFGQSGDAMEPGNAHKLLWLAIAAWLLLVTAASRPQWLGEPVALPVSGRDLMLAIDLSESMREQDFQLGGQWVDRLTAGKSVARNFIERREGDRLGLILFGAQAYLQTPLTFDRDTVLTLLDEAQIGLAGQATAIGDAVGLAIKRLRDKADEERVLILMTDGANTSGEVDPLQATELAAREGLKIYTIGIGADEMIVRSFFGNRRVNPSADLDEQTLRAMAEQTGGRYFRARDTGELEDIYRLLDELEPVERNPEMFRPTTALFPWPLAAAFCLLGLLLVLQAERRAT